MTTIPQRYRQRDGRTDRRTDNLPWQLPRSAQHRAVNGDNDPALVSPHHRPVAVKQCACPSLPPGQTDRVDDLIIVGMAHSA